MTDVADLRAAGKAATSRIVRSIAEAVCAREPHQGPIRKYALISTPRVGSTVFSECLRATGKAGWPLEWLNARYVQEFVALLGPMKSDAFVDMIIRKTTTPNGVFGINFHVFQYLEWKERGVDLLSMGFSKVYWIERSDKIAQAYSYAKGLKTDLWSKEAERAAGYEDGVPLSVTPSEVAGALALICRDDALRADFPVDRRFVYEEIAGRLDEATAEVLQDFGESSPPVRPSGTPQSTAFDKTHLRAIRDYFMGVQSQA